MRADEAIDLVGKRGWNRRSAGAGSKGARDYAWAWIATASQHRHLSARRNLEDPTDLAYFYCYSPPQRPPATLATLVRVAGMRWPVEEDFGIGIDHFGLDLSQVRLYTACCATDPDHRRQAVCAVTAAGMRSVTSTLSPPPTSPTETPPPDPGLIQLTVAEVKRLYNLFTRTVRDRAYHLRWVWWRCRHRDAATKPAPAGTTTARLRRRTRTT